MLNLNSYPYFDDYNPDKGYHKILFHPAKPIQARELTQIQSILQAQIKRHGDHVFKNGTMVIPGHVFYDDKVKFLKLETVYNQINVEAELPQMVGKKIKGDINGIEALVIHYDIKTTTEPTTIYIKYTTASGTVNTFKSGETMTCPEIPGLLFKVSPVTEYTGNAAICSIGEGVYYINGYFVQVLKQTITVSKYNNTASAVVGLDYIESIVTENEDESLYDNAFGFTNYGAPGSHRLKITLNLAKKDYNYSVEDASEIKFIDLLKVKAGKIEYLKDETKYAEIEKWLARRTYEESGNYVTRPFKFKAFNYRNNDRGTWAANKPYLIGDVVSYGSNSYVAMNSGYSGSTAPTHDFGVASDGAIYWNELPNKSMFLNGGRVGITSTLIDAHIAADDKMIIETSPGKAYVKGFEITFNSPTSSIVSKARTTKHLSQAQIYAPAGSYVRINNLKGLPNISTNLTSVNLLNVAGATVGTAWVRSIEYLTGTPNVDADYRLFLFGIKMTAGYNFARDVHAVSSSVMTASVIPTLSRVQGSATVAGTTVTGKGTYFDFDVKIGDRIKIGSTWTKVTSIISPTSITVSPSVTETDASIWKGVSEITKLGDFIREMPNNAISTLRNSNGLIDMQYVVQKSYSITTTSSSYNITLTNGETFLPTGHIVVLDTGTVGTSDPVNASFTLDGTATTLTISGLNSSNNYKVIAVVKRTGQFAKEKTKTLAVKTLTLTNSTPQKYTNKVISLTEADCVRIIKIQESGDPNNKTAFVSSGATDITHYFKFDNGQRAEFYDVGKVTTTRNCSRPIRITFEYFVHSEGDYFSADSYATIPTALLQPVSIGNKNYFLPDCLDFRSRISDNGREFNTSSGASISDPLSSEMTISTSYSYFLPRQDTLGIDIDGAMNYNIGGEFADGMKLATIDVAAFTANPSVDVKFTDDQIVNYTMEDVKKIDTRLQNVEYYVALSELEKATVNTSIKDEFGLEREKNGFLVDEFSDFSVSATDSEDLLSSIEPRLQECCAMSVLDGVQLVEAPGTTAASRAANNYQLTGSYITLPYTEEVAINQTMASTEEVIQAYATIDFTGKLTITPSTDNYTEHKYATVNDPARVLTPRTDKVDKTSRVYGGVQYVSRRPTYRPRRGGGE